MPLPKPKTDENRAEFLSRCIPDDNVQNESSDNDQALAICTSIWDQSQERSMNVNDKLLSGIRSRQQKQARFGYGILTADKYVRTLLERAGSDACYDAFSTKQTSFDDVLRKAARTLVYCNPDMVVEEIEYSKQAGSRIKEFDGIELPKNTLMVFRHVLTSPRKDRDGDILRSEGAEVDPKMLLLWQHVHTLPIGKLLKVAEKGEDRLSVVSCIVDMNALSHDAAVMVDNGMGRFSHGFRALEFDEIKGIGEDEPSGFDVKKFEIMEESLVSVPSNIDADTQEVMLSLVEEGKLTSPLMKEYGKTIRDKRNVRVPVKLDIQVTLNGKEISDAKLPDRSGKTEGGKEGGDSGTSKEADEAARKEKGTKNAEVKMMGLEGSWEYIEDKLRGQAKSFLTDKNVGMKKDDWVWLYATFSNYAVISWEGPSSGATKYFKVAWIEGVDGPEFTGELKEVKIKVELEDAKIFGRRNETRSNEKAGRTLNKANEGKIRNAREGIDEVVSMDGMQRPAKAVLRESSRGLGEVLTSLGDEGETSTPTITVKEAMAVVIACATVEQRNKMKETLEVLEKADAQRRRTSEFNRFMGVRKTN